jgi:uncharacterized membrane protein
VNYFLGEVTSGFYFGLPIGALCGLATCLVIWETWDPVQLRPKNPNEGKFFNHWYWFVPLGVIVANIFARLFSNEITDLFLSCTLAWLFLVLGYIAFQVWRNQPN